MWLRLPVLLLCVLALAACSTLTRFSNPNASGYRQWEQVQCVPYARDTSGIRLRGDAYTWWDKAQNTYARGTYPEVGAVMVLARTNKLRSGHLAVVKDILGPRDIMVTHANWGNSWTSRRVIYETMRVQDASANNNWSSAKFWNNQENVFGFPYAVQGFIYNRRP